MYRKTMDKLLFLEKHENTNMILSYITGNPRRETLEQEIDHRWNTLILWFVRTLKMYGIRYTVYNKNI